MRKYGFLVAALLSVSILGVQAVAQQARDRDQRDNDRADGDRICFYRDVQFQGQSWCYRSGDELADLRDRRNEISSIRITGRARVIVYDLREFEGASDEFDTDVPDLTLRNMEGSRSWNDRIDSFQIVSGPGRRRGFFGRQRDDRPDRDNAPSRDRICVYEDPGFRGRSQCWDAGEEERNLNRANGWNDRISSIRVYGRARVDVYRDADYRGQRLRVDRDTSDLNEMNWGDQISSFEVR